MKIAIYPGSFDPITNGHLDVITRAQALFDRVIVAVAKSERKQPCIPAKDRLGLVADIVVSLPNVEVVELDGLLVDVAKAHQATYVVKGLRNSGDFEYESQQAWMNAQMSKPPLQTVCFFADHLQDKVSSTMVREIASLGGEISAFVPGPVCEYLQKRC